MQQQAVTTAFGQLPAQGCMIERQVHRVSRLGVGELKVQLGAGGQAGAGAAQGNACGGQASQFQPRIVRIKRWFFHINIHPNCARA